MKKPDEKLQPEKYCRWLFAMLRSGNLRPLKKELTLRHVEEYALLSEACSILHKPKIANCFDLICNIAKSSDDYSETATDSLEHLLKNESFLQYAGKHPLAEEWAQGCIEKLFSLGAKGRLSEELISNFWFSQKITAFLINKAYNEDKKLLDENLLDLLFSNKDRRKTLFIKDLSDEVKKIKYKGRYISDTFIDELICLFEEDYDKIKDSYFLFSSSIIPECNSIIKNMIINNKPKLDMFTKRIIKAFSMLESAWAKSEAMQMMSEYAMHRQVVFKPNPKVSEQIQLVLKKKMEEAQGTKKFFAEVNEYLAEYKANKQKTFNAYIIVMKRKLPLDVVKFVLLPFF